MANRKKKFWKDIKIDDAEIKQLDVDSPEFEKLVESVEKEKIKIKKMKRIHPKIGDIIVG